MNVTQSYFKIILKILCDYWFTPVDVHIITDLYCFFFVFVKVIREYYRAKFGFNLF